MLKIIDADDLPGGFNAGEVYKEAIEVYEQGVARDDRRLRKLARNHMLEDLDLIEYEPEPEN